MLKDIYVFVCLLDRGVLVRARLLGGARRHVAYAAQRRRLHIRRRVAEELHQPRQRTRRDVM